MHCRLARASPDSLQGSGSAISPSLGRTPRVRFFTPYIPVFVLLRKIDIYIKRKKGFDLKRNAKTTNHKGKFS